MATGEIDDDKPEHHGTLRVAGDVQCDLKSLTDNPIKIAAIMF
jgi:hypothetical protein